jgi:hypothetical protein
MKVKESNLLLSENRGVNIPRDFVDRYDMDEWNVTKEQAKIIGNPDHELYWEVWDEVIETAYRIDTNDNIWKLMEFGDIFEVIYVDA